MIGSMVHSFTLQPRPFAQIQEGTKTIEVRLYDEKRQALSVGDEIEFSLTTDSNQKLHVKILELIHFKTFEELFSAYPPNTFGFEKQEDWTQMYRYYTKEQEEKYGVLGIKIERLSIA